MTEKLEGHRAASCFERQGRGYDSSARYPQIFLGEELELDHHEKRH
jgi:hypothetical protein